MQRLFYAVLVVGVMAWTAQAGTILLVSDAYAPGDPTPDKPHEDDPFVTWLGSLGHTVDTYGMGEQMRGSWDATDQQHADDADLIIVSRRTSSGSYNNPTQWNTQATPLILCSDYLIRDSRWKWTDGGRKDADNTATDLDIDAAQTGHPFVAGVTDPASIFDWTAAPGGVCPKGPGIPAGAAFDDEATVIGILDDTNNDEEFLVDLPAGATMSNGDVLGARRAFLGHWGYDNADTDQWDDYITDDYKTVLGNTVTTLIPEPATLALLGVGLGAMLIRRRK